MSAWFLLVFGASYLSGGLHRVQVKRDTTHSFRGLNETWIVVQDWLNRREVTIRDEKHILVSNKDKVLLIDGSNQEITVRNGLNEALPFTYWEIPRHICPDGLIIMSNEVGHRTIRHITGPKTVCVVPIVSKKTRTVAMKAEGDALTAQVWTLNQTLEPIIKWTLDQPKRKTISQYHMFLIKTRKDNNFTLTVSYYYKEKASYRAAILAVPTLPLETSKPQMRRTALMVSIGTVSVAGVIVCVLLWKKYKQYMPTEVSKIEPKARSDSSEIEKNHKEYAVDVEGVL